MPTATRSSRSTRHATQKGRQQRKASTPAKQPDVQGLYKRDMPPIRPGEFTFEIVQLAGGRVVQNVGPLTESLGWADEAAMLTGQIVVNIPHEGPKLTLGFNHEVRLRVIDSGRWYELWRMRCAEPETSIDGHTLSIELKDDLTPLQRSIRDWSFRRTKRRRRGWRCDEITRQVAKKEGVRVRRLEKGKHRLSALVKKEGSGLDVIREAYIKERDASGRRFVIRMRDGMLEVVAYRRNPVLYTLEREFISGTITRERGTSEHPYTVITGHASVGRGKRRKKVTVTVHDRGIVAQFGYHAKAVNYGNQKSRAALTATIKRELALNLKTKPSVTVTYPGIPFINRGDAVRVFIPEHGLRGKDALFYAQACRHQLDGSGYTTDFDLVQDDPFRVLQDDADKAKRDKARKTHAAARKRRVRKRR